ncbi:hypothetical protein PROPHIGD86-1_1 [Mycobacterium phage prophi86-1]|nr:hypothetical protein PROPHIGD86-1_1 [Mycobacterium phage prophi86-1]
MRVRGSWGPLWHALRIHPGHSTAPTHTYRVAHTHPVCVPSACAAIPMRMCTTSPTERPWAGEHTQLPPYVHYRGYSAPLYMHHIPPPVPCICR